MLILKYFAVIRSYCAASEFCLIALENIVRSDFFAVGIYSKKWIQVYKLMFNLCSIVD